MPAKPTKLPVWGKTTAPITEPSAGFQGAGYVEGDKPAADHLNFLFTAFSEWVTDWLDPTVDDSGLLQAAIDATVYRTIALKPQQFSGFNDGNWTLTSTDGVNNNVFLGGFADWITETHNLILQEVRVYVAGTGGTNLLTAELFTVPVTSSTGRSSVISVQTSGGGGAETLTLTAGGSGLTLAASTEFLLDIGTDGGGAGTREVFGVEIDVTLEPA